MESCSKDRSLDHVDGICISSSKFCGTSNDLLHKMFALFVKKNQFAKFYVVEMDRRISPLSSGAKVKSIASVVEEKNYQTSNYHHSSTTNWHDPLNVWNLKTRKLHVAEMSGTINFQPFQVENVACSAVHLYQNFLTREHLVCVSCKTIDNTYFCKNIFYPIMI